MLSIIVVAALLAAALVAMRRRRTATPRALALVLVNVLVVEAVIFAYFLFLVYRGTCFTLIGNQAVLDAVIRARLIYSTYFAQGYRSFVYQLDNDLGYTVGKNKEGGPYRTNRMGVRADREYPLSPPPDALRLGCFGDSFVFCDGEANRDCWTSILESSVGKLEVVNLGVSGYGLSQAYSRYLKDGLRFSPDVVFINYVLLGDRDVVAARRIASGNLRLADFYRVVFSLNDGHLRAEVMTPFDLFDAGYRRKQIYAVAGVDPEAAPYSSPLLRHTNAGLLVKHVLLGRRFRAAPAPAPASADVTLDAAVVGELLDTAIRQGSQVIFFCPFALADLPAPVRAQVAGHGDLVVYVDSRAALRRVIAASGEAEATLYNSSRHFNARGNRLYAQAVQEIVTQRAWGRPGRQFAFDPASRSFVRLRP